jgi:hypothetical protein
VSSFRNLALAGLSLVALTGFSAPAGSQNPTDCGPALTIQDSGLRAKFAHFNRTRTVELGQVCMMYREKVAGFSR